MPFSQGHALLIGVGAHQHCPWLDLPGTAADAEAVAEVLQDGTACGYPAAQVRLITRRDATRAGILAALDDLAGRAGPGDIVFVLFSGHGALGADDSYYLAGYDVQMEANRIVAGAGVSESDLLGKLQAIRAAHVFLVFNACHGGAIASPRPRAAAAVAATTLTTANPPEDTVAAILGTGKGRIVVTACRTGQRSHTGSGPRSLFAQALVSGLDGRGGEENSGYITAFGLYAHLYATVAERARALLNEDQEPELAVLRGAGSYPVALYQGPSAAGAETMREPATEPATEPLPQGAPVREVDPEESARSLAQHRAGSDELQRDEGREDDDGRDLGDLDDTDFVIGNIRK